MLHNTTTREQFFAIFSLASDQIRANMWPNGVWSVYNLWLWQSYCIISYRVLTLLCSFGWVQLFDSEYFTHWVFDRE